MNHAEVNELILTQLENEHQDLLNKAVNIGPRQR